MGHKNIMRRRSRPKNICLAKRQTEIGKGGDGEIEENRLGKERFGKVFLKEVMD